MKTAIVYVSNHGATEQVARELSARLHDSTVQLINLRENKTFSPDGYDCLVVGGSIHAGKIQRRIKDFCMNHTADLLRVKLGLFVCCMHTGEQAVEQFNQNFPELLRHHAVTTKIVGGAFNFEKMNWFEKMIVRKVAGVTQSTSNINQEAIEAMASELTQS